MKTILVTGGAGFIGSHLCEKLLNRGDKVICLDNFFTGDYKNIKRLLENKNFELIKHDVEVPYSYKVDEIYNMASPAAPVWYQKDPVKTVRTNVLGAINALELAQKRGAKVLQASTSEVYGDPKEHPQKESYVGHVNPLSPRACYDEGKRCAETLFMDYHREYGTQIKIVRIFNTYGPRVSFDDGRVISNFILQALRGEDITIYGDGSQTRSFCYVDDMTDGLIKMMESNGFVGPVNLGNPQEKTIKELAEKILNSVSTSSKIVYKELPEADPTKRKPDITLAKEKLDWEPQVDFDKGLVKTVEYFRGHLSNLD
jgi:UDP-glucuronate decarboxylase